MEAAAVPAQVFEDPYLADAVKTPDRCECQEGAQVFRDVHDDTDVRCRRCGRRP